MKRKLIIGVVVLLVVMGAGYKFALAKPAKEHKPHIAGEVYVLPKDFLVNLQDGRYVKLDVALLLAPGASAAAGGSGEGAAKAPEGYGALPQEAAVRAIVTDSLTSASDQQLLDREGRDRLRARIMHTVRQRTDVKATDVLFTDLTVQ